MTTQQDLERAVAAIQESFAERSLWRNGNIAPQRLIDLQLRLNHAMEVCCRLDAGKRGFPGADRP